VFSLRKQHKWYLWLLALAVFCALAALFPELGLR